MDTLSIDGDKQVSRFIVNSMKRQFIQRNATQSLFLTSLPKLEKVEEKAGQKKSILCNYTYAGHLKYSSVTLAL